jgi:hypothetical protein
LTIGDPEVVGTFANCVFQILHGKAPILHSSILVLQMVNKA